MKRYTAYHPQYIYNLLILNIRPMKNGASSARTSDLLEEDLQKLVSIIRQRQSTLLLLFQERHQKQWQRPQWLLKQCEYQEKENRYSRQIRSMILRWALIGNQQNYEQNTSKFVRSFWIKVKMVIKMSLQRIKILNLLNYQLFQRYQSIIEALNISYDRIAGISHYRDIEEMIKSRNKLIHDILNYKTIIESKPVKNIVMEPKVTLKESSSETIINQLLLARKHQHQNNIYRRNFKISQRPFSQTNNRNMTKNARQKLIKNQAKNIQKFINNYEQNLKGVLEGKIDILIDKKKPIQENIQDCYDELYKRNVANHKTISKFIFYETGRKIGKLLSKKKLKNNTKKLNKEENNNLAKKQKNKKVKLILYGRASSAKLKYKQILKIRNNNIFDPEIKTFRAKKCM